jgi:hypothetical protein
MHVCFYVYMCVSIYVHMGVSSYYTYIILMLQSYYIDRDKMSLLNYIK